VTASFGLHRFPFEAVLPDQFDKDVSKAVTPFATKELEKMPDTYPFGL
jgi:hypothetical protein